MTQRTIKKHLVKFNDLALPDSFVALGTQLDPRGNPSHAGILIRINGKNFLHHYGRIPQVVDFFDTSSWFLYKVIDLIKTDDVDEIEFFLNHCRSVCKNSKIVYSCVLDGSIYNKDGQYESKSGLPEFGTCVSFCINTLSLFCIDTNEYLQIEDWDAASIPDNFYLDNYGQEQAFKAHLNIDKSKYNAYKRRISPLQYLCSAFFNDYPIKKQQIDDISEDVEEVILQKFNS